MVEREIRGRGDLIMSDVFDFISKHAGKYSDDDLLEMLEGEPVKTFEDALEAAINVYMSSGKYDEFTNASSMITVLVDMIARAIVQTVLNTKQSPTETNRLARDVSLKTGDAVLSLVLQYIKENDDD